LNDLRERNERARLARRLSQSLEPAEQQAQKHEALRTALEEGERSGVAKDSSLEGVLAEFRARRR
jgi:Bacterial antitoxin of ParD toxin-antitoxin type II system and RHH